MESCNFGKIKTVNSLSSTVNNENNKSIYNDFTFKTDVKTDVKIDVKTDVKTDVKENSKENTNLQRLYITNKNSNHFIINSRELPKGLILSTLN
mgnify:CR=1 FL=1